MIKHLLKWSNKFCIALIIAAFIFGLSVSKDYGNYMDQHTEEDILMYNIGEYKNILLGEERFNGIHQSTERDHGVAPYYPLGIYWSFRMKFEGLYYSVGTAYVWHLYTFVLFFFGCLALYGIVYELFRSHKLALFSFFLYYFTPRFFAEGHYNNKDVIFLTFGLISIYFAIRYICSKHLKWGLLFACAAAFMTNIKILGAWFFAVPGIVYLVEGIKSKGLDKKRVIDGFIVIFAYLIVFTAITPAFLRGGFSYIKYCLTNASSFTRWSGRVVYAGKTVNLPEDMLSWDYLPLNILYTVPLILLLFSLVGHIRAVVAIIRKEKNSTLYGMVLILYLVPFIYAVSNRNLVIYNGWRHFYFVYGGIAIFMAVGCQTLLQLIKNKWLKYVFCGGVLAYLLCLIVIGHPYQYSYINILAKRPAEMDWQLDYWSAGSVRALTKLYESESRNRDLELSVSGCQQMKKDLFYDDRWNGEIFYVDEDVDTAKINYVICNMTYDSPPEKGYHLLFTIEAYGNCLYQIYEMDY